jgi:hydrogenase expression/formation protein HypC
MCLAIPVRIEELQADDMALVDIGGIKKAISIALVDDVAVGDYVILHVGYALNKVDADEAEKTLELFAELSEFREMEELSQLPAEAGDGS